jgi:hypothetical protein
MKKLVASVGMVALGASGLQTAFAQGLDSPDPVKPWSVSATLRGFYDDNRDTLSDDAVTPAGYDRESFGIEVAPSARVGFTLGQTVLSAGYTYSYKWFEEDSYYDGDDYSQSHDFNLAVDHAFSPRARMSVRDSFVIGQEPDQLRSANTLTTLQRVPGDNLRNEARIQFEADLTRQFGIEVGYANSFFDYEDDFNAPGNPSLSGRLDRMRHMVNLDGRLTITPSTVGVLGYAYSDTDYLRDEIFGVMDGEIVRSDVRNNRSHYAYVGADHSFTSDLSGSVRVGARYSDYYNDPSGEDAVSPYARASVRYAYMPASYVEAGLSYDRTATDIWQPGGGDFTLDQEAGTIFASVHHQILPKLVGSLLGQAQNSTFNGGLWDDEDEQFYMVGLNLEYQFNRHFAAHVGYNYDFLDSDIPGREYDRNRVYVGVTATY